MSERYWKERYDIERGEIEVLLALLREAAEALDAAADIFVDVGAEIERDGIGECLARIAALLPRLREAGGE